MEQSETGVDDLTHFGKSGEDDKGGEDDENPNMIPPPGRQVDPVVLRLIIAAYLIRIDLASCNQHWEEE